MGQSSPMQAVLPGEPKVKTYKWLRKNRTGGFTDYQWPEAGEWTVPVEGDLLMCENGYHLVTEAQIIGEYIQDELWEAEYEGDRIDHDDKICVRRARLVRRIDTINERTLRLFAVIALWRGTYPNLASACSAAEAMGLTNV